MWKYIDKDMTNEFLLSLFSFKEQNNKKNLKLLYSISNNKEKNYRLFKIKKRNGKTRTIYEPNYMLKNLQKQILENVLNNKEISKYAKAYKKGISLLDNAKDHLNKKTILKLDIKDFFSNIKIPLIYDACFPIEYFPKQVGFILTHLCTYEDFLPQGAPTSSYISNLVMKEFDNEIGKFCEDKGISYTRYSDDMTFSGDFDYKEIIKIVRKKLLFMGLELNNEKIKVITNNNKQLVTGIVVNKKLQIEKTYRKKIRQEIYYIKKYGIDNHLERISINNKDSYLKSLYGKVLYVLQINKNDKEFKLYKKYLKEKFNL